jgi:cyclic 2,3-diphosphoglycerate synthase
VTGRRAVVLVDGEHHPPVVRDALRHLGESGTETVLAVVLGGGEKIAVPGVAPELGVPTVWPAIAEQALPEILRDTVPDVVVELSGEPVVSARRRLRLAAVCLACGLPYEAPGVLYAPPELPKLTTKSTVAVVATGKRTGKTAVSGALARHVAARDRDPVVVAMGRGGPVEPTVVAAGQPLDVEALLEVVSSGGHAASDFYEDAVMTGVATIGCRRIGDGPSGMVAETNVADGVRLADEMPGDLVVLEGSGAAVPPCHPDAVVFVLPATLDAVDLAAPLPFALLLADLVVVTFADDPTISPERLGDLAEAFRAEVAMLPRRGSDGVLEDRTEEPMVVPVALRPHPVGDVGGRRVFFATTAPERALGGIVRDLEETWGAEVVGATHRLADRPRLERDLAAAPPYDVLLTELKAAAVDVAASSARSRGAETVFCDNRPSAVTLEQAFSPVRTGSIEEAFDAVIDLADRRRSARGRRDVNDVS